MVRSPRNDGSPEESPKGAQEAPEAQRTPEVEQIRMGGSEVKETFMGAPEKQESPREAPASQPASTPKGGPSGSATPQGAAQTPGKQTSNVNKLGSMKSQVSFSAGSRMTTDQFLNYRQKSSLVSLLPSQFFESRAEIRTWGEEDITDPSIQPYNKDDANLPRPFHVSLPGYAPRLCQYVINQLQKEKRDPMLGPDISVFPPTWVPHWTPDPNFKPQKYGYNWEDSEAYKMDRLPYVNAEFDPISAEATHMYNQYYPYTAYPYGVPRV